MIWGSKDHAQSETRYYGYGDTSNIGHQFKVGENVFDGCNIEHVHPNTNHKMKLHCNGDWVFSRKNAQGHYQVVKTINVTGGNTL